MSPGHIFHRLAPSGLNNAPRGLPRTAYVILGCGFAHKAEDAALLARLSQCDSNRRGALQLGFFGRKPRVILC